MKTTIMKTTIFIFSILSINLYGILLPTVISSDLSLPAGTHTLSNQSLVQAGVTLTFSPVSTLQLVTAESKLVVLGTLEADGTTFTGKTPSDKWGQILCEPGSEITLLNCLIDNGGGLDLPPPPLSNAMFYARGATVTISNTVATRSRGDCYGFVGGNISFFDNTAAAVNPAYGTYAAVGLYGSGDWPTVWQSSGNTLTGTTHQGIWVAGDFTKDISISAKDVRLNVDKVDISNCTFTISGGTQLGFYDYTPGSLTLNNNATLMAEGTDASPIVFSNYYGLNPWSIKCLSGSKSYYSWTTFSRPISFTLSNSYICVSNSYFSKLENGLDVNHSSQICAFRTTFSGMVNQGVMIQNSSTGFLRECTFLDNNPPYMNSLNLDGTSVVDTRYCWWNATDGPYPYGNYFNERINTNGNVKCFPWLVAAPGSQTNPPNLAITSPNPATEPVVVSGPQILLLGTATDDSKVTRIEYRNLASDVVGVASLNGTSWEANFWLFEGENQIGLTAYDDEGNASVAGIIVDCTGAGVGDGGNDPPMVNPLPDRVVPEGVPLVFGVGAYSPETAILSYWAENLPDGATFDQVNREFSWNSPVAGTYNNILFMVTDGIFVASNLVNITVVAGSDPPVNILTKVIPDAYKYHTYYVYLSAENAVGPISWSLPNQEQFPDGMVCSRSGIISGVPTDKNEKSFSFDIKASDSRGNAFASTKTLSLSLYDKDPPNRLRITTQQLPFCVSGTAYNAQLEATNGIGAVNYIEASKALNPIGLAILNDGSVTGTVNTDAMIPWSAIATDDTNASDIANLVVPAIKPDEKLELIPGENMLKLIIKQAPQALYKSKIIFKAMLKPPVGFTLDADTIATAMAGVTQIDGGTPLKSVLDKKVLFKVKTGPTLEKILVKKLPDGNLKVKFILKNVELSKTFESWGLKNEDLLTPTQFDVPIFIRIGDFYTVNEVAPTMVKSKFNKFSKGKAKW